mmetsp:Transcript_27654/g.91905  ORF Transcript_27654/g.91905 Transcript_27654/m.91905 type:complete len:365 (+) Transcript_27654:954-2048(+)
MVAHVLAVEIALLNSKRQSKRSLALHRLVAPGLVTKHVPTVALLPCDIRRHGPDDALAHCRAPGRVRHVGPDPRGRDARRARPRAHLVRQQVLARRLAAGVRQIVVALQLLRPRGLRFSLHFSLRLRNLHLASFAGRLGCRSGRRRGPPPVPGRRRGCLLLVGRRVGDRGRPHLRDLAADARLPEGLVHEADREHLGAKSASRMHDRLVALLLRAILVGEPALAVRLERGARDAEVLAQALDDAHLTVEALLLGQVVETRLRGRPEAKVDLHIQCPDLGLVLVACQQRLQHRPLRALDVDLHMRGQRAPANEQGRECVVLPAVDFGGLVPQADPERLVLGLVAMAPVLSVARARGIRSRSGHRR